MLKVNNYYMHHIDETDRSPLDRTVEHRALLRILLRGQAVLFFFAEPRLYGSNLHLVASRAWRFRTCQRTHQVTFQVPGV